MIAACLLQTNGVAAFLNNFDVVVSLKQFQAIFLNKSCL